MRKVKISLISTTLLLSQALAASNPEPVIYGTITLTNGQTVTGSMQWGDQETFLSDIYNGKKLNNSGIQHLTDDERDDLINHQPGPQANIGDFQITFKSIFGKDLDSPYFNVNFGAIQSIEFDQDVVTAKLHDNSLIISDDDDNDTGADINVKTHEGEVIDVDHDDIKLIEFSAAPDTAKTFGDGIYGTVESSIGTFSGRVMWDKDERLMNEELDGHDHDGEHNIQFKDIKSIEKAAAGATSKVVLNNGEVLNIGETNDVNNSNRGIWLDNPEYGRIEISWKQFKKLTIAAVGAQWLTFADYRQVAAPLRGTITLMDDTKLQAQKLTFDMNQESSAELLYADMGGNNRQVPLYKIKSIHKKSEQGVELVLQNGDKMIAANHNSVNRWNNGVLASNGDNHQYIKWADLKSISFE